MLNRILSFPIPIALVFSLIASSSFVAKADPGNTTSAAVGSSQAPASTPSVSPLATSAPKHTISYIVLKGDSLTSLAQKFNTTRKKLKALNNLTANTVKPGQVLLVPSLKNSKSAALAAKAKAHHEYLMAQPVQDFDIPASTFASCPVPIPSEDEAADSPAPPVAEKPAPIAKLVSPAELAAAEADDISVQPEPESAPARERTEPVAMPVKQVPPVMKTTSSYSYSSGANSVNQRSSIPVYYPPALQPQHRTLAQILGFAPANPTPANDWGSRFLLEARMLGNQGIEYDEDWRPPGESRAWTMDCSNTTRYLYKVTTGIQLPRTASDQYYYLHLQGKAWDVPQDAMGLADTNYLRQNLRPGDLLFWENTYRPERQPPITHVMVFLGTNDKGQWIMAGSQTSRGGEHNRRNGGPDIYVFRPSQPCGGYTTWLGLVHHTGRFCAFGRPLEADPTKLAVATDD